MKGFHLFIHNHNPFIRFRTNDSFMISGWFKWVNFLCYLERIGHYIIKTISFRCFDLPLRLPRCSSFRLPNKFLTHMVKLLNELWVMLLGLHLKILISLIKSFKMLMITKISHCGAFKLRLLSGILCLIWIFHKLLV